MDPSSELPACASRCARGGPVRLGRDVVRRPVLGGAATSVRRAARAFAACGHTARDVCGRRRAVGAQRVRDADARVGHAGSSVARRASAAVRSVRQPFSADEQGLFHPLRPRLHHISQLGALVLAFTAIVAVLTWPQVAQLHSVPDLGDPLFSMWRMGWVFQQLQGDPRALFDANIFHPTPLTLTLSDSMLVPSLIAAPLFAAGLHPLFVYNGLLLAAFPINGFATYLLIRKLTGSAAASFIGALFYMCHPYRSSTTATSSCR